MFEFYYQTGKARRKLQKIQGDYCSLGSARDNEFVINHRAVSKRHSELSVVDGAVHVRDLGSASGTWVNRERVRDYGPLNELDEIVIGETHFWIRRVVVHAGAIAAESYSDARHSTIGLPTLDKSHEKAYETASEITFSGNSTSAMHLQKSLPASVSSSAHHNIEHVPAGKVLADSGTVESNMAESDDSELQYWGRIVHEQLISEMDLRRKDVSRMTDNQLRVEVDDLIQRVIENLLDQLPASLSVEELCSNVLNEAVGLGPLEKFLGDESITEIMVNNHREIFLERGGKLEKSPWNFSSNQAVYAVIERIITPIGRRIDESSPIVDARLKDGSRVNAIIPPLALKGPSLTIRKFPKHRFSFDDLISTGSVSTNIVDFLRICVEQRKNIIVSGGTGSGKTTLLNVLSNFIPNRERIVTIEDAAELKLVQPNLVSLESRPGNAEGRGVIAIRDLVKNALRMRPDRIVVGECRGGEAIDMLQAMNTGHDGSLTTIHANNPRDVISRLEVLVLMAGMDLPVVAIREQIASAVDIIIQQTRYPCGTRKINQITEVVGVESGTVQLQDIFKFKQSGIDDEGAVTGQFSATGFIPGFYETLAELGKAMDISLFSDAPLAQESDKRERNPVFSTADSNGQRFENSLSEDATSTSSSNPAALNAGQG